MKQIAIMLLCIMSFSCASHRKVVFITPKTPIDSAKKFVDSLMGKNVDTIMIFYQGCSGCYETATKTAYVFWRINDSTNRIKRFDSYTKDRPSEEIADFKSYFFINEAQIRKGIITYQLWSHYHYTSIKVFVDKKIYYEECHPDYLRYGADENNSLLIWMQQVESLIFNHERLYYYQYYWR